MGSLFLAGSNAQLGYRVAQRLRQHTDQRLIERVCTGPLDFAHGDVLVNSAAAQQLIDLFRAEQVQTVIHLDLLGEDMPVANSEGAFQHNVLGTLALLGVCLHAGVRRVVLRSSTLVYGASNRNPMFIGEHAPVVKMRRSGLLRDYCELDLLAQQFARNHPQLEVVLLRCAGIVGDRAWSPLSAYLMQPAPPVMAGYSPRIQMLHPDDAAQAFVQAALGQQRGAFNLAARDPLGLGHAIRRSGRQPRPLLPLPSPLAAVVGQQKELTRWFADLSFLYYACVGDTRRAHAELGWQAQHSTYDLLDALAADRRTPSPAAPAEPMPTALLPSE